MKKCKSLLKALYVLLFSFLLSLQVFASEADDTVEVFLKNDNVDEILYSDLQNEHQIASESDFKDLGLSFPSIISSPVSIDTMATSNTGDQYEANDMYTTATTGLVGKRISATLHNGDVDWYKFEVYDLSEPYAFVLMDIPVNCNYDMLLATGDLLSGYWDYQEGNTYEYFYVNLETTGTYYVCIQSNEGFSNNPYTLYFGPAFKSRNTGWRSTGLTFNFGYKPQGGSDYKYSTHYYYDLSVDGTIPNGAVMTQLYMDNNGNGGTWGGFYKYIKEPSGYGMELIGNLDTFSVPNNAYYVKQNWEIWGKVLYSYSFVWQPNILIGYKYLVAPQTMRFVS